MVVKDTYLHTLSILPKLWGNCAFLRNVHTWELGKISVFYAVDDVETLFIIVYHSLLLISPSLALDFFNEMTLPFKRIYFFKSFLKKKTYWSLMTTLRMMVSITKTPTNIELLLLIIIRISKLRFLLRSITAWKVSKYGVFSVPYFPAFRLNTERLRIQSECGKIRTRKTPYFDTFHAVQLLK